MKFSYSWLSDYVKSMPEPKKLAELFTLRAYQVESIEKKGSDTVFDIELLPNRFADLAGHIGIAHEIHAIYGSKFLFPKPD
ncbi:MAG: Phenylalanine-tRNA ligase beta subunit, partial [Parcubacteria group bacterium GW2011_GWA2_47_10b]